MWSFSNLTKAMSSASWIGGSAEIADSHAASLEGECAATACDPESRFGAFLNNGLEHLAPHLDPSDGSSRETARHTPPKTPRFHLEPDGERERGLSRREPRDRERRDAREPAWIFKI